MYPEPESWPPPGIQQPPTIDAPIADPSDPMAQAVSSLPAIVPITPIADVVLEAQGPTPVEEPESAPVQNDPGSAQGPTPVEEPESAPVQNDPGSAATVAPGADTLTGVAYPNGSGDTRPVTEGWPPGRAETPPGIRYVKPGDLQIGDVIGFHDGPLAIADKSNQGALFVMADCTIRSFTHLEQVPVLPF